MIRLFLLSLFFSSGTAARDTTVTEYYDKEFRQVRKEKAVYYRIVTYNDSGVPVGKVKDYFLSGKLQWEGQLDKKKQNTGLCTWYYENGQKQSEVNCENGYYKGHYKEWYENGKLAAEGDFVPGNGSEPRGYWVYYYANGKKYYEGNYTENHARNGTWKMYTEKGKPLLTATYVNGGGQGVVIYYEKGKKKLIYPSPGYHDVIGTWRSIFPSTEEDMDHQREFYGYRSYAKEGLNELTFPSGKGKCTFTVKDGKMEGLYTQYNPDGTKDQEGMMLNNRREGSWKSYSREGELYSEITYHNGSKHGPEYRYIKGVCVEELWYHHGKKLRKERKLEFDSYHTRPEWIWETDTTTDTSVTVFKTWYVDTLTYKKTGLMAEGYIKNNSGIYYTAIYYENGQVRSRMDFDPDNGGGSYEEFYVTGRKKGKGTFSSTRKTTIQQAWDSSGKMIVENGNGTIREVHYSRQMKESVYRNGFLQKITVFTDSGTISSEEHYKDGVLHGSGILYYPGGKKQQDLRYENGKLTASYVWYPNGNLRQEMHHSGSLDDKEGPEIHFYENGTKMNECIYVNGERSSFRQWNEAGKLILEITYDEFGDELERKTW